MTKPKPITLEEAAELLGVTPAELTRTRHRGLSPGSLGFTRPPYDGTVFFDRADLEALELETADVPAGPESEPICPDCGFRSKSTRGLRTHRRVHESEAA